MTRKFDGWPWKIIRHLFYTTSSFVHHFKSIGGFKQELQFGNAQFGSKPRIFCPVWLWNLQDDLEKQLGTSSMLLQALCIIWKTSVNQNLSYSAETLNSGQNRRLFVPCDHEIWRMTLINIRARLLYCVKLCALFHSHQWILTGIIVRKRPIWVKIDNFFSCETLKFDRWPWKTIKHLF